MSKKPLEIDEISVTDVSHLEGEVLTIIDAIFPAPSNGIFAGSPSTSYIRELPSQNKAMKDLVRAAFSRAYEKVGIARS